MKYYLYLSCGIIFLWLLAACNPAPQMTATSLPIVATVSPTPKIVPPTPTLEKSNLSQSTPTTASPVETTTLILWEGLPAAQSEQLTADLQTFQAAYPHYRIELHHYNDSAEFATAVLVDQTPFDLVLAAPPLLNQLWLTKKVAPMADFFPASFINNFAGVTLQGASRNGELWGLSDTAGFQLLLFYNHDLVETPPTSMAELLAQAKTITETTGHAGLGFNSYDPLWLIPWLAPYNAWLTDETGQPTLNSLGMEAALTNYLAWQRAPGVLPSSNYDAIRKQFVQGQLAFMIDGDWAINELTQVNNLNWGVTPLPTLGASSQPAAPLVLARYWAISRQVKGRHAQAAAAFVTFITRSERQLACAKQFGQLPTQRAALNDRRLLDNPLLRPSVTQMLSGRGLLLGVEANLLLEAMRFPLAQALDGKLPVKAAIEAMQQNAAP